MAQYIEVEEAINLSGLRVVLSPGVPGPWSEAAKGILRVKQLPYVKVRQVLMGENLPLKSWSAQTTAPVFAYNDEPPRSTWIEQLYLAERLKPDPALVPPDIDDRMLMFGLSNEICGQNGLGWSRRLMLLEGIVNHPGIDEKAKAGSLAFGQKYGYQPGGGAAAPARVAAIVRTLATQLANQQARGRRFMVGEALTALDIYWAAFAALIHPLPDDLCKMSPGFRKGYECIDPAVVAAATPQLMEHRDFIYNEYLELPVDL